MSGRWPACVRRGGARVSALDARKIAAEIAAEFGDTRPPYGWDSLGYDGPIEDPPDRAPSREQLVAEAAIRRAWSEAASAVEALPILDARLPPRPGARAEPINRAAVLALLRGER